jgi:hypothetical protein
MLTLFIKSEKEAEFIAQTTGLPFNNTF